MATRNQAIPNIPDICQEPGDESGGAVGGQDPSQNLQKGQLDFRFQAFRTLKKPIAGGVWHFGLSV